MSATLGALVIAISTEFSVLLTARYREERAAGPRAARRAAAHLRVDRRRGARLGRDGDRRLRGARALRRPDAPDFGLRHRGRPVACRCSACSPCCRRCCAGRAPRRARPQPQRRRGGRESRQEPAGRLRGPLRRGHRRRPRATLGRRRARRAGALRTSRSTRSAPTRPAREACAGETLPPFAVPLATLGTLGGDANVARAEQGRAHRRATCAARASSTRASWPSAARSCSRSSPRATSAASARSTCSSACAALPGRRASRRSRSRRPRRRCAPRAPHGWRMPVGYDHDGAVSNLYAVAICPTITFADTRREGGGHDARAARTRRRWPRAASRRCGERRRPRAPAGSTRRVAAEFPELALWRRTSTPAPGRSPPDAARAAARRSPTASAARRRSSCARQPIPHAYRVFFRHIGLDPDEHRTPVEALALERLKTAASRRARCSTTR